MYSKKKAATAWTTFLAILYKNPMTGESDGYVVEPLVPALVELRNVNRPVTLAPTEGGGTDADERLQKSTEANEFLRSISDMVSETVKGQLDGP